MRILRAVAYSSITNLVTFLRCGIRPTNMAKRRFIEGECSPDTEPVRFCVARNARPVLACAAGGARFWPLADMPMSVPNVRC